MKLQHKVVAASWHEERGQWRITVERNGHTSTGWCKVLVNGSGLLDRWHWPNIPGLKSSSSFSRGLSAIAQNVDGENICVAFAWSRQLESSLHSGGGVMHGYLDVNRSSGRFPRHNLDTSHQH
jgi:hypothetical protein